MEKLRILHTIPSLSITEGGPSQVVADMLHALEELGAEVALLTTLGSSGIGVSRVSQSIPTHCFESIGKERWGISLQVVKWLRENLKNYDVVHIHKVFTFVSFATSFYCRKFGVPYVLRPAGMLDKYCLKVGFFRKWLYRVLFETRNLECAAAIQCTTTHEKYEIERLRANRNLIVIPLGTNIFENSNVATEISPVKTAPLNILYLSRLDPKKGIENLIRAVGLLKDEKPHFVLSLVGTAASDYVEKLKKLAQQCGAASRTEFKGFLTGEDKLREFQKAFVFVLPSFDENFGVAVIEAMACGVPVAISNHVGICQTVLDSHAGVAIPTDPEGIAKVLKTLISNPAEVDVMRINARLLVEREFRWQQIAKQLELLYKNILAKKKVEN